MNVHQRIKAGRERLGLTQDDFAAKVGVSRGAVQHWEKEDDEGGTAPNRDRQAKVAKLLGMTVAELMADDSNVYESRDFKGVVPLISWVQAGDWDEARNPLQPDDVEQWVPCAKPHSEKTYALRVRGDSMTAQHGKSYPEGCLIVVDPERRMPKNGDRIIAKLRGSDEVTFKVYKEEDGRRWLQALNASHLPIREPFSVLGTIIGKWEDD